MGGVWRNSTIKAKEFAVSALSNISHKKSAEKVRLDMKILRQNYIINEKSKNAPFESKMLKDVKPRIC